MKVFVGDRKNIPERSLPEIITQEKIYAEKSPQVAEKISPQFCTGKASRKNNLGYQATKKISFPHNF
jgi:hypothetical protein